MARRVARLGRAASPGVITAVTAPAAEVRKRATPLLVLRCPGSLFYTTVPIRDGTMIRRAVPRRQAQAP